MWFIGVEVEQETSAPPPKKSPGSAPVITYFEVRATFNNTLIFNPHASFIHLNELARV